MVAVAGAYVEGVCVPGQKNAARALADRDRLDRSQARAVDDRDRIVLLVGDIDRIGERYPRNPKKCNHQPAADQPIRHFVSGLSMPSVSSSEDWWRNPGCGETETSERASASKTGWRSWPSHDRKLSRTPL